MKKISQLLFVAMLTLAPVGLRAQSGVDTYNVDASTNGSTVVYDASGNSVGIYDNGGPSGRYTAGDHYLTVSSNCADPYRFCLVLSDFDIACTDTLYIYDGATTSGPIRAKINNCTGSYVGQKIFVSKTNTSGKLTVRFAAKSGTQGGRGFALSASCDTVCETIYAVIDSAFYRTRHGVIYDTAYQRQVPVYDTVYNINADGDTLGISSIDTSYFMGIHLCVGDGVIFRGHGVYTHEHGYYNPSDANTTFTWDFAHDNDIATGVGLTEVSYADYQTTGCYDLTLTLVDVNGCTSNILTSVRVRTSLNPIKTIFTLADICNNSVLPVNMGYDGEDATLTLRTIESNVSVSKINEIRNFIPDGPNCASEGSRCYSTPVTFTEFPAGKKVTSGADVCSICVNMEHTYMGDISIYITCPTGQKAALFYGKNDPVRSTLPEYRGDYGTDYGDIAADHGQSTNMGHPNRSWDSGCDSLNNPFGNGLDYCWSRNGDYVLVTGVPANTIIGRPAGHHFITCRHSAYMLTETDVLGPTPSYFTSHPNETYNYSDQNKRPSNHLGKSDYYLPYTDFSELIGCPLNGTWAIEVCDHWQADNGWVFNWSMDICGVSQDEDCKYEVGIDSLVWRPDPSPQYHDYDMGQYRGVVVDRLTPTLSEISTPDTAGTFPINVFIYDDFGCVWDTTTRITSYWTPQPHLGPDTTLCGVDQATLDGRDRHTGTEPYKYVWEPYGQNTPTIETATEAHGDITYIVQVRNAQPINCVARDTIKVALRKQPLPNFTPEPFSFEGCEPMTIKFNNQSIDAISHLWVFGDGVTSELESPTHTYAEGIYTLKYYATSDEGCVDSIISNNGIAVYPTPQAAFSWEPVYPSVLNPTVNFSNETQPQGSNVHYFWEVQYDSDYPLSYETLTTKNPRFNFSTYSSDNDPSGNYAVSLIAYTENQAPSGAIVRCSDTASNNILVINDFLQFPNVVTPNGDGINDRFVIQNLVNGMGYPINSLYIYNRWGTMVYHKENISSDADFWDPAELPAGTYFYRFSAKGYNGNIEHNGSIEVIK